MTAPPYYYYKIDDMLWLRICSYLHPRDYPQFIHNFPHLIHLFRRGGFLRDRYDWFRLHIFPKGLNSILSLQSFQHTSNMSITSFMTVFLSTFTELQLKHLVRREAGRGNGQVIGALLSHGIPSGWLNYTFNAARFAPQNAFNNSPDYDTDEQQSSVGISCNWLRSLVRDNNEPTARRLRFNSTIQSVFDPLKQPDLKRLHAALHQRLIAGEEWFSGDNDRNDRDDYRLLKATINWNGREIERLRGAQLQRYARYSIYDIVLAKLITYGSGSGGNNGSDEALCKQLLETGGARPIVTVNGRDLLTIAVSRRKVSAVRLLLQYGCLASTSALVAAVETDQRQLVRMLIDCGANPAAHECWSLRLACRRGQYMLVRQLVSALRIRQLPGGVASAINSRAGEALQWAASHGRVDIVRLLIKCGARVNSRQSAALQCAATNGHVQVVRLLINSGAQITAQLMHLFPGDCANYPAMTIAATCPINRIEYSAADDDAQLNISNRNNNISSNTNSSSNISSSSNSLIQTAPFHALQMAAANGHVQVVQLLLIYGADVHQCQDEALRLAAKNGHLAVVRLLLQQGANPRACNNDALRLARSGGHSKIELVLNIWLAKHPRKLLKWF